MKGRKWFNGTVTLVVLLALAGGLTSSAQGSGQETVPAQAPVGTAFTYQGLLTRRGYPANDTCDLRFGLWDDPSGGSLVAGPLERLGVSVVQGRFTAQLEFGPVFDGTALWLAVEVRCAGDPGYTALSPRHELTAAPYSGYSLSTAALQGRPVTTAGPSLGQVLEWDGVNWVPAADDNTTYSAGFGLVLSGTVFSANPDQMQVRVSGTCADGSAIRQVNADGTVLCELDDDSTYTAGTGLELVGSEFSIALTYRLPQVCAAGQIAEWNDAAGRWDCGPDDDTTYAAGTGLELLGNQFSILATYRLPQACASGEIPAWDGTSWVCAADSGATDHGALTGLGDDDHVQYFHLDQDELVNGTPSFNGGTPGLTPPFAVDSDGWVQNLHVDLLDGYNAGNAAGQIPVSNGTLNANLNADLLDGYNAGNAAGTVPVNNGVLSVDLNADLLDGLHASDLGGSHTHDHGGLFGLADDDHPQYFHLQQDEIVTGRPSFNGGETNVTPPFYVDSSYPVALLNSDLHDDHHAGHSQNMIPISDYILNVALNADLLDGRHAGNASGDIPISNGALNVNLNADLLDGFHAGDFAPSAHDHWGGVWTGSGTGLSLSGGTVGLYGSGSTYGLHGQSSSRGVYGQGGSYGVYGSASTTGVYGSASGYGVYGSASSTGVFGTGAYGVYGQSSGTAVRGAGGTYGVLGNGATGVRGAGGTYGVYGTGTYGVYGSGSTYAGYFSGNVRVTGTLYKGGLAFSIDHPLDPANRYLNHSGVESTDMKNLYDGVVVLDEDGTAWVQLPAWFEALNGGAEHRSDFRYQLTPIGAPAPGLYIAREIEDNRFQIAGGPPGLKVSWLVTGIRHDPYAEANRIPVEVDKPEDEKGLYLHPELYGQPPEKGLGYQPPQEWVEPEPSIPAAEPGLDRQRQGGR